MNDFNYEPETINKFEIISTYFVNIYYNNLFHDSITKIEKNIFKNNSDAYKYSLNQYINYVKINKHEFINTFLQNIKNYFNKLTKYKNLSNNQYIHLLFKEFVIFNKDTKNYNEESKVEILYKNIYSCLIVFSNIIITNLIPKIMNERTEENAKELKNIFFNELISCREKNMSIVNNTNKSKVIYSNNQKLERENKFLKENFNQLQKNNEKLVNIIKKLQNQLSIKENEKKDESEETNNLNEELEKYNNQIKDLNERLDILNKEKEEFSFKLNEEKEKNKLQYDEISKLKDTIEEQNNNTVFNTEISLQYKSDDDI